MALGYRFKIRPTSTPPVAFRAVSRRTAKSLSGQMMMLRNIEIPVHIQPKWDACTPQCRFALNSAQRLSLESRCFCVSTRKRFLLGLPPEVLCHRSHGSVRPWGFFPRRFAIGMSEVRVHPGARRIRMDLDEQLTDHLPAQSLTHCSKLARSSCRTFVAGESDFETQLRVVICGGEVHRLYYGCYPREYKGLRGGVEATPLRVSVCPSYYARWQEIC